MKIDELREIETKKVSERIKNAPLQIECGWFLNKMYEPYRKREYPKHVEIEYPISIDVCKEGYDAISISVNDKNDRPVGYSVTLEKEEYFSHSHESSENEDKPDFITRTWWIQKNNVPVRLEFEPRIEGKDKEHEYLNGEDLTNICEQVMRDETNRRTLNEFKAVLDVERCTLESEYKQAEYAERTMILLDIVAGKIAEHPEAFETETDWRIHRIVDDMARIKKELKEILS